MTEDTGGPAFPQLSIETGKRDGHGDLVEPFTTSQGGMSLRQWYAGQCNPSAYDPYATFVLNKNRKPTLAELAAYIAEIRWLEADAMIAERNKP